MTAGRKKCPECGARDTECTSNWSHNNYRIFKCRRCSNKWKEYTGPECPSCGSNNTRKNKVRCPPHSYTEIVCSDCGRNKPEGLR